MNEKLVIPSGGFAIFKGDTLDSFFASKTINAFLLLIGTVQLLLLIFQNLLNYFFFVREKKKVYKKLYEGNMMCQTITRRRDGHLAGSLQGQLQGIVVSDGTCKTISSCPVRQICKGN